MALAPRGGKRLNAGRKPGSGFYGEPTKTVRVPISQIRDMREILTISNHNYEARFPLPIPSSNFIHKIISARYTLPFFICGVAAGAPFMGDDTAEVIDVNKHLFKNPETSFCVRVIGNSMIGAGIFSDDLLIVDKEINPTDGKIVIASINGELTVKRLSMNGSVIKLIPDNPEYQVIEITENSNLRIIGVVVSAIRNFL